MFPARPLSFLALLLAAGLAGAPATATGLSEVIESWLESPHADWHSPSFTHWNEDGAVPPMCAACHSEPGFLDWLGADGSAAGSVEAPAAINAPVGCASCHVAEAEALDAVPFPSGVTVAGLGPSATCAVCHQGRQSGPAVARATATLAEDTVSADLAFLNVHYGVAAAMAGGAEVAGGYEYPGQRYVGRFAHVPSASTCISCHDPHTTRVQTDGCVDCHQGTGDLRAIRTRHKDFDGDGATHAGIHAEVAGLHARLGDAIRTYASAVSGTAIGYEKDTHPYFFADPDGDGTIGPAEAVRANAYKAWTPRLLKAAYNYQFVAKDPGAYVHNPAYALQLLHDSLASLAEAAAIDTSGLVRP